MSFNRAARRSETRKAGEPLSHKNAVTFICDFIGRNMYQIFDQLVAVHAPLKLRFTPKFIADNKGLEKKYPGHAYDIGCTVNRLPVLVIEVGDIGDDTKHNLGHEDQLINDGIAKKFIEENYPDCKFIRINKDDSLLVHELKKLLWKKSE